MANLKKKRGKQAGRESGEGGVGARKELALKQIPFKGLDEIVGNMRDIFFFKID